MSLSEITRLAIRKYAAGQTREMMRETSLAVVERLVRRRHARVGVLEEGGAFIDVVPGHAGWGRAVESLPDGYNPFDEDRRSRTGP